MRFHRNAKLGLAGRRELVRAIAQGSSLRQAATTFNVSVATAHRWWRRWSSASEQERRSSTRRKISLPLGAMAAAALEEQYQATRYRDPGCIVFSHPALGTPLDPSKLTKYARKALNAAGLPSSFRPWHGLRHTALTETAAAGVPSMFVQAKAGHAHGSTTERYLHAHKTSYPDAAELAEARLFGVG